MAEEPNQQQREHTDALRHVAPAARGHFRALGDPADTFRFVLRGSAGNHWYGMFGPQAERIAREFLHSTTMIVEYGTAADPYPGIPVREQLFVEMARELVLNRGMKLELWERDAADKWECIIRASPGRLEQFEGRYGSFSSDGTSREMGCVAACHWHILPSGEIRWGCAYVNTMLRTMGVAEFGDTPQCTNLESFLLQIGAREVILPVPKPETDGPTRAKVDDVLKKLKVMREEVRPMKFTRDGVEQMLDLLLRDETAKVDALKFQSATQALSAVVSFMELTKDACNEHVFRLRRVDLSKYMRLDQAAMVALNLMQTEAETLPGTKASILAFLDECCTGMGSRQLRVWLSQPLLDAEELRRRHAMVEMLRDDNLVITQLRLLLKQSPDIDKILKRLQRKRGSLTDCLKIGDFARLVPAIRDLFKEKAERLAGHPTQERVAALVSLLTESCELFENLNELVDQSIVEDKHDRQVMIKPNFDDELARIHAEKQEVQAAMEQDYHRVLRESGMTEKILTLQLHPTHGRMLRATKQGAKTADGHKKLTKLGPFNGAVWYSTNVLKQLNDQSRGHASRYEKRQTDLTKMLMETVGSYTEPLDDAVAVVTEVDILAAFATVASRPENGTYTRPDIVDAMEGAPPVLEVTKARHPLVQHQLHRRGGDEFVPNDVRLGGGGATLAMITGPNMGGKSTYIRTAGVCVLLAHVGMLVPCDAMRLSVCDALLARLGAADCMTRGVSTFMAEMLETAAILDTATSRSFVMVDELGRGTSTHDGFGLAWGIAEHLAEKIGCPCLFATHFHELTDMERALPRGVTNLHVTADTGGQQIRMLYEVRPGACSRSFGINVAEITKFPGQVIAMAKRKSAELEAAGERADKKRRVAGEAGEAGGAVDDAAAAFLAQWLRGVVAAAPPGGPDAAALHALRDRFDGEAQKLPPLQDYVGEIAACQAP